MNSPTGEDPPQEAKMVLSKKQRMCLFLMDLLEGRTKVVLMHCSLWIAAVLYILVGAAIMLAVEGHIVSNFTSVSSELEDAEGSEEEENKYEWNYQNSVRFIYGIITTTGTGGMMPSSNKGMVLSIVMGLPGIPFVILVLADMGKFLMDGLVYLVSHGYRKYKEQKKKLQKIAPKWLKSHKNSRPSDVRMSQEEAKELASKLPDCDRDDLSDSNVSVQSTMESELGSQGFLRPLIQLAFFFFFLALTAALPMVQDSESSIEKFFKSFLMITSLSFGDIMTCSGICVKRVTLLLIYATMGIMLMTMSIEAAAEGFRKIHHLGSKLKDVSIIPVWFGGTKVTIGKILNPISRKYDIPMDDLEGLVKMTAEGKEWQPTPPPPEKPILIDDFREIFGDAVDDISYGDSDSIDDL